MVLSQMQIQNLKCKHELNFSLRCCGSLRFDLYGLWRLICLRNCFANFYYLPENCNEYNEKKLPWFNENLPDVFVKMTGIHQIIILDIFRYFLICHQKYLGETINCTPKAQIDDGFTDMIVENNYNNQLLKGYKNGKFNLAKLLLNQDKGDYFDNNGEIRNGSGVMIIFKYRLNI